MSLKKEKKVEVEVWQEGKGPLKIRVLLRAVGSEVIRAAVKAQGKGGSSRLTPLTLRKRESDREEGTSLFRRASSNKQQQQQQLVLMVEQLDSGERSAVLDTDCVVPLLSARTRLWLLNKDSKNNDNNNNNNNSNNNNTINNNTVLSDVSEPQLAPPSAPSPAVLPLPDLYPSFTPSSPSSPSSPVPSIVVTSPVIDRGPPIVAAPPNAFDAVGIAVRFHPSLGLNLPQGNTNFFAGNEWLFQPPPIRYSFQVEQEALTRASESQARDLQKAFVIENALQGGGAAVPPPVNRATKPNPNF